VIEPASEAKMNSAGPLAAPDFTTQLELGL